MVSTQFTPLRGAVCISWISSCWTIATFYIGLSGGVSSPVAQVGIFAVSICGLIAGPFATALAVSFGSLREQLACVPTAVFFIAICATIFLGL